jgi:hypothetical protein
MYGIKPTILAVLKKIFDRGREKVFGGTFSRRRLKVLARTARQR